MSASTCFRAHLYTYICMRKISDQAPWVRMSAVAGVKSPRDVVPWVEFLSALCKKDAIELEGKVHLVTNIKQGGLVHRLAEGTRHLPRERRRSRCGWRVGGAAANVRFTKTSTWPPCKSALLCSRCFASGGASATETVKINKDETDGIED